MGFTLLSDETLDDLQLKGLFIIQKKNTFRFGTDAVLLSSFVASHMRYKKKTSIVDMGTGTGIIPILLSAKTEADQIVGLEIQKSIADMAKRSVEGNDLENRITIINGDIRKAKSILGPVSNDIVVSNPPYTKVNSGFINADDGKTVSRHEVCCTLMDLLQSSFSLLKPQGEFFMVHRPERLADVIDSMRRVKIEPKILRMVSPKVGKAPMLILVKGIKNANPGLKILPELILYHEKGDYTEEAILMYSMGLESE